jgi:hypothetical protein
MPTFQYVHPSCNLREETQYTHFSRSVDTNACNPMTNELKSNIVPLTFNYNAEITYPLGVCKNTLLQIGPIREDHQEEQLWNNYQFKKHYAKHYNREHTINEYNKRRQMCKAGGRIGCVRMEEEIHPDFLVNDINRSEALKKGKVAKHIHPIDDVYNRAIQT